MRWEVESAPGNREIFKKNREAIEHERAITERELLNHFSLVQALLIRKSTARRSVLTRLK
jgi:hypothetical protein